MERARRTTVIVLLLLFVTGCASGPPVREVDAKLMARNFLHGRQEVNVAAGVGQPDVPYRFMTDFRAEKTGARGPDQFTWKITVSVTEGPHRGRHTVLIDPEKKQIVGWTHEG